MKTRKAMKHSNLVGEVVDQLKTRFKPSIPQIKKCIDILLEKEYIERSGTDKDMYNYMGEWRNLGSLFDFLIVAHVLATPA